MKQKYIFKKAVKIAVRAMFCLLTLLCTNIATAQDDLIKSEYSYRRYTTQDGLPNMMVYFFHQDEKGVIWIATNSGFASFDGIKITNYLANTGKNFLCFRSKPNGELWAYNMDSVFVLDRNRSLIRNFKPTNKGQFRGITSLSYMPEDYFIIHNIEKNTKFLMKQVGDTMETIVEDLPELNDIANDDPYLDLQNNKLYLPSAKKNRVSIYDLNTQKITYIENFFFEFFLKHSALGLLAFAGDGIYKIDNNAYTKFIDIQLERNKKAIEMKDGSIIIMDRKTIYRYAKGEIEMLVSNPSTYFINIFADREENIWLATFNKGMYNFFHFDFRNLEMKDEMITSVVETNQGDYLIGTFYGNLYKYSDNKTEKLNYPRLENDYNFNCGTYTFNDAVYIPRSDGILKYQNKQFQWLINRESNRLSFKHIKRSENGDFIANGTYNLYIFDKNEKLKRVITSQETEVKYFNHAIMDSNGTVYAASGGGEEGNFLIIGDTLIQRNMKYNMHIVSVEQDFEGNIWCCSPIDLLLLQSDTLAIVHHFQEMAIKAIKAINRNYLLIATTKGIYFFNSKRYFENGEIQMIHYDHNYGMKNIEAEYNALYRDRKGLIWLIGSEGVTVFDPEQLIRKTTAPVLSIQQCLFSTDNVNWENAEETDNPVFNYNQNNVRFLFMGLKYSAIENVRYHYRLKGFQNEWSEPIKNREVTFNNLPSGDYVFEIYADAGTDESRSEIQSFAFSIKPAFWQTWWFIAISILSLMMMSALVALYFQRKKNLELLQRLSIEKQLNDLRIKSIRLKAIPHFNANVLSAIEYYIMNRSKEEANHLLGIYSNFTYQTLREVDRASRSLQEELDYVQMYLQLEKLRFTEKFDYNIEIDPSINKEVQLPNMVLHTYCENAIKHAFSSFKSGGTLKITAKQENNTVQIAVEDNGIGRRAAQTNTQVRSTKQGLDILNRQIEIYNSFNKQKIVQRVVDLFNDGIACGTRFILEVPLGFVYK